MGFIKIVQLFHWFLCNFVLEELSDSKKYTENISECVEKMDLLEIIEKNMKKKFM